ncbi:MAG TPA: hypothetical protein VGM96_20000, partial [Reyranella sp.]
QLFNTTRISSRLKPGGSEHMKLMGAVMGDDRAFSRAVMGDHLDNVRDAIIDYILGAKRS